MRGVGGAAECRVWGTSVCRVLCRDHCVRCVCVCCVYVWCVVCVCCVWCVLWCVVCV